MIVDLSIKLNKDTPAYPGDPTIAIRQAAAYSSEGYLDHSILLGTHTGTHIDAPAHMIEGGPTLGRLPLDSFMGHGKLVQGFSKAALEAAGVTAGDIVLFDTGTGDRFYDSSYFTDYPVLPDDTADYLIEKKVKAIGMDTCSADNAPGFPVHKKIMGAGILIIENLANLAALRGQSFEVIALPLNLDLDGAPVRAVAVVHDA